MMKGTLSLLTLVCVAASGQPKQENHDEAKAGAHTLPDPLLMTGGERVTSADTWRKRRRPEILKLFEANVYGRNAGRPRRMSFELTSIEKSSLEAGKPCARRCRSSFPIPRMGRKWTC